MPAEAQPRVIAYRVAVFALAAAYSVDRALAENAVIVAQMTPFFDED